MERDTDAEAHAAVEYLGGWLASDFDSYADQLDAISVVGEGIIEELRRTEGDARGVRSSIEEELRELAGLVRGSLYLVRKAVDTILDPPAVRPGSREEVIERLLHGPV